MLLDAGSDVNKASNERETALHYAARYGHTTCIGLLLDCVSVDINARTIWGLTPLMLAAGSRCGEAGLALVGAGAAVSSRDRSGRSALHHAVKNDMRTLSEWLLELGADCNAVDSDGNTPLIEALAAGKQAMVALLVRFGCRVREVVGHATLSGEYRWCTAFELAVHLGHTHSAHLLYAAGCNFSQFLVPVDQALVAGRLAPSIADWISRCVGQPRPLVDCVRIAVREALDVRQQEKLSSLPLPPALLSYIGFTNEREFDE